MDTDSQDESVRQQDDAPSYGLTGAAEMRRGASKMVAICVAALVLGRLVFWHGPSTTVVPATALFFLLIYTIFGIVQLIFGASINELYKNFTRMPGRLKLKYIAMIALSLGLLWVTADRIFPDIWERIF